MWYKFGQPSDLIFLIRLYFDHNKIAGNPIESDHWSNTVSYLFTYIRDFLADPKPKRRLVHPLSVKTKIKVCKKLLAYMGRAREILGPLLPLLV